MKHFEERRVSTQTTGHPCQGFYSLTLESDSRAIEASMVLTETMFHFWHKHTPAQHSWAHLTLVHTKGALLSADLLVSTLFSGTRCAPISRGDWRATANQVVCGRALRIKGCSGIDTTADRSSCLDLCLHVLCTAHCTIFCDH